MQEDDGEVIPEADVAEELVDEPLRLVGATGTGSAEAEGRVGDDDVDSLGVAIRAERLPMRLVPEVEVAPEAFAALHVDVVEPGGIGSPGLSLLHEPALESPGRALILDQQ